MMRILITGANGQLGNELQRLLAEGRGEIGPIPSCYQDAQVICTDYQELDITDEAAVTSFFEQQHADLVINCAAMTNVDGCEKDLEAATRLNAYAAGILARAAEAHGAKLAHISTDYVFSGDEAGNRVESDVPAPKSAYGRTKLAGEEQAAEYCSRTFILRTAWLYGYVGRNFVKTMLGLGAKRDQVTVVDDQLGNPTSANDLAYEILQVAATEEYGIYHCTNEGTCSWADFAQAIMEGIGLDCQVVRCSSAQYKAMNPASADRPAFSSLENWHLAQTVGNEMRPWQDALASYLSALPQLGANPSWSELMGE